MVNSEWCRSSQVSENQSLAEEPKRDGRDGDEENDLPERRSLPLQSLLRFRDEVDDRDQQQDADDKNRNRSWHGPASPLARLLVAGQHVIGALPWRREIERAEFLVQFDRLVDDALGLVVVANLDKAGQREILAQRVALKAVVGE